MGSKKALFPHYWQNNNDESLNVDPAKQLQRSHQLFSSQPNRLYHSDINSNATVVNNNNSIPFQHSNPYFQSSQSTFRCNGDPPQFKETSQSHGYVSDNLSSEHRRQYLHHSQSSLINRNSSVKTHYPVNPHQTALELLNDLTEKLQRDLETRISIPPAAHSSSKPTSLKASFDAKLNEPVPMIESTTFKTPTSPYFTPICPAPRSSLISKSLGNLSASPRSTEMKKTVHFREPYTSDNELSEQRTHPTRPTPVIPIKQHSVDDSPAFSLPVSNLYSEITLAPQDFRLIPDSAPTRRRTHSEFMPNRKEWQSLDSVENVPKTDFNDNTPSTVVSSTSIKLSATQTHSNVSSQSKVLTLTPPMLSKVSHNVPIAGQPVPAPRKSLSRTAQSNNPPAMSTPPSAPIPRAWGTPLFSGHRYAAMLKRGNSTRSPPQSPPAIKRHESSPSQKTQYTLTSDPDKIKSSTKDSTTTSEEEYPDYETIFPCTQSVNLKHIKQTPPVDIEMGQSIFIKPPLIPIRKISYEKETDILAIDDSVLMPPPSVNSLSLPTGKRSSRHLRQASFGDALVSLQQSKPVPIQRQATSVTPPASRRKLVDSSDVGMGNVHRDPAIWMNQSGDLSSNSTGTSSVNSILTPANDNLRDNVSTRIRSIYHNRKPDEEDTEEACSWLRAAGFPQYAQMYQDNQFPVDLESVREDHNFLDEDSLQALFRRLALLNTKIPEKEIAIQKSGEDEDDDVNCAISDRWTFEQRTRRWSRVGQEDNVTKNQLAALQAHNNNNNNKSGSYQLLVPFSASDPPAPGTKDSHDIPSSSSEHHGGSSVIRTASLRFRSAVSRFRRGDISFRSLRRSKKGSSAPGATVPSQLTKTPTSGPGRPTISGPVQDDTPDSGISGSIPARPETTSVSEHGSSGSNLSIRTHPGFSMAEAVNTHVSMVTSATTAPLQRQQSKPKSRSLRDFGVTALTAYTGRELDPVLDLLMSDVNSIDQYRSNIKGTSMRNLNNTHASIPTSKSTVLPSGSPMDVSLDSPVRSGNQRLFSEIDSYDLESKISDLIQLEGGNATPVPRSSNYSSLLRQSKSTIIRRTQTSSEKAPSEVEPMDTSSFPFDTLDRPSDKRSSFYWSPPGANQHELELMSMSVSQIAVLKKLATLRLTSIMEKHCPGNNKTTFGLKLSRLLPPRLRGQHDVFPSMASGGSVFGQPLTLWQRRYGQPLLPALFNAMTYLSVEGAQAHGIFRRAGGKTRTKALREAIEKNHYLNDFSEWQPYDVADMLKQFFRELPECLLTNKLSATLISIFSNIPESERLESLRWSIVSLPDENRVLLQILLHFLNDLARHDDITQMTVSNLAVCLSPSLFHIAHLSSSSPRRTTSSGGPDPRELAHQLTAQKCLALGITEAHTLFSVHPDTMQQTILSSDSQDPPELSSVLRGQDWQSWMLSGITALLKDTAKSRSGWVSAKQVQLGVDLAYRKAVDQSDWTLSPGVNGNVEGGPSGGFPLRTWRGVITVNASPLEVLHMIWDDRSSWDPEVTQTEVIEQLSDCVELCRLYHPSPDTRSLTPRQTCLLRGRQHYIEAGGHAIVGQSVTSLLHPACSSKGILTNLLEDKIYVEHCAGHQARSRVHWISRADIRGQSPEWYVRHWGDSLARRLVHLRDMFPPGPQSSPTAQELRMTPEPSKNCAPWVHSPPSA